MVKVHHSSRAHRSFHLLITVIAGILVLSGIVLGIWFYIFNENHEETNDAQVEQYVTPIMARITGYVAEVRYNENQFVQKGDTLIVIDNREYQAHLNMALADVENAKSNSITIEKSVAATSNTTSVRKAKLEVAKTEVWKTKLEFNRYKGLISQEATTEQQLEKVKADYELAQAHYQEIAKTIQSAALNTAEASAKIPTAQTVIKYRQAAADAINGRELLGSIESLSPASGARFSLLPPDNATGNFIKIEQRIPVRIKLKESDAQTDFLRAGMNVTVIAEHK